MAHLLYRMAAREDRQVGLILNPYAAAPLADGYTAGVDLLGMLGLSVMIDFRPGLDTIPSNASLVITAQEAEVEGGPWRNAGEVLRIENGSATPPHRIGVLGTPPTKTRDISEPFPAGTLGYNVDNLAARFCRFHYVWTPTAYPLLIAAIAYPRKLPSAIEWEVAS